MARSRGTKSSATRKASLAVPRSPPDVPGVDERRLRDGEEHGAALGRAPWWCGGATRPRRRSDNSRRATWRDGTRWRSSTCRSPGSRRPPPRRVPPAPVPTRGSSRAHRRPPSPRRESDTWPTSSIQRPESHTRPCWQFRSGDLQDDPRKGAGIDLAAAERARQEHVEEPGVDQLGDEGGRQAADPARSARHWPRSRGGARAPGRRSALSKPHALDFSRMSHHSEALRSSSPARVRPFVVKWRRASIWVQMRRQGDEGRRHQRGDLASRRPHGPHSAHGSGHARLAPRRVHHEQVLEGGEQGRLSLPRAILRPGRLGRPVHHHPPELARGRARQAAPPRPPGAHGGE